MLTKEQNDLLTQTGRATPGGALLRRYWQPVALAEELPAGGPPLPVRIFSEDLVLFRDEQGRPGLLAVRCSHRGADLSYGRIEGGGLRCLYHGWLYDVAGNCMEQPGEPAGSTFKERVKHPAYPCQETGGIIFTYMGPGESPLLPAYEFLTVPEEHRYVNKVHHECNYLQGNEGNIDPVHLSFLHRFLNDERNRLIMRSEESYYGVLGREVAPETELENTDFGLRIFTVRDAGPEQQYLRVSNFVFPNLSAFPGSTGGDGYSVNWHVPIDDIHHWKYQIVFRRTAPLDREQLARQYAAEMTSGYRLVRNKENRYLQNREQQKTETFTGMGTLFAVHDKFAVEGEGPILDRTQERLASSDKAIARARQMLLRAIEDLQAGRDPLHVVRRPEANQFSHLMVTSELVPRSVGWRDYWKERVPRQPSLAAVET